ncbi:MAG TPA: radical SAM protein, partial [Lachnospiraceae bacterium]|nr:radical SAM protein [Lachnospiraceae bacterium]
MLKSKEFKRIYIEITNICNLSCSFCPALSREQHRMTTKEFEHILKEISPYTDYVYLHVKGEPLIHPDIDDILALCDKYHMYANITTNGTLIASRKEILYHAKALRQVNISLHSFEDPIILKESKESAGAGCYFESRSQTIKNNDILQAEQSLFHYLEPIVEAANYFSAHTDTITALRLWNIDSANMDASSRSKNGMVIRYLENSFEVAINPSELSRGIKLGNRIYLNQDYEFTWPSMSAD